MRIPFLTLSKDRQITWISALLLMVVAVVSAATGFVSLRSSQFDDTGVDLTELAAANIRLVSGAVRRATLLGQNLGILLNAKLSDQPGNVDPTLDPAALARLDGLGIKGIRYVRADGREQVFGSIEPSLLSIPLRGKLTGSMLVWAGATYIDTSVSPAGPTSKARVEIRVSVPGIDAMLMSQSRPTEETKLCAELQGNLKCFPDAGIAKVHDSPRESQHEGLYPVARAIDGTSGVMRFQDFLGHRVLAAYAPVGDTGLGLVQKLDISQAYSTVGTRLLWTIGLPLLAAVIAVFAILRGVQPLLARMIGAEEIAEGARKQLRTIADHLPVLICYIDQAQAFRFNNAMFTKWLETPLSEITGRSVKEVCGEEIYGQISTPLETALKGESTTFEVETVGKHGERRFAGGTFVPDRSETQQVIGVHGMIRDITKRKRVEETLIQEAQFDALTLLPNRTQFMKKLEGIMSAPAHAAGRTAVMFLDLDHFKTINDELGHHAGDEVLKEFARRLRDAIRPTDLVARLAGDEFVVLLGDLQIPDGVRLVASKIISAMQPAFQLDGEPVQISVSIGIAFHDPQHNEPAKLMKAADQALYQAKAAGRNTFIVHELSDGTISRPSDVKT